MTRLMVMNDPHNSDRPPLGRTETYEDDILAKQEECWDIARRTKCDFIVQPGDIFHRFRGPQIADSLKVRLIGLYQQAPCPVYAVAGNHDCSEKGIASIWNRPFGVLAKAGAFTWLEEATVIEGKRASELASLDYPVILIPRNWQPHIDTLPHIFKRTKTEAALREQFEGRCYNIMVTHSYIYPPGHKPPIFAHHMADKLSTDSLDLLICSHVHEDLGIHQLPSGCWYVNPGSLARVDRSPSALAHKPQVLTVTLEGGEIEFERHPLKSVRPVKDVFFEKDVVTERQVGDYMAALDTALELEETPIDELIAKHTKGQPPAVVERLRQYLTEAEG